MFHLSLYPVFDSYLLVAVVALLLVGLMWFGPSREKAGRRQRVTLALLRAAVIAMIVLAMLRPTLIYTQTKKQAATLVVLADQSRSMSVPDAVGNKTRWEALRDALDDAAPALAKLQRDFELKAYAFDADLHEVGAEGGKIQLPDKPEGQQTAIGAALKDVLGPRGGQTALGRRAAERRRPAGLRPARSAAANGRRAAEAPRLSPVHRSPSASRAASARPRTWPSRTWWSIPTCS